MSTFKTSRKNSKRTNRECHHHLNEKHEAYFYTRNQFDLIQGHKNLIRLYSSINEY